jgi:hypothetical protein
MPGPGDHAGPPSRVDSRADAGGEGAVSHRRGHSVEPSQQYVWGQIQIGEDVSGGAELRHHRGCLGSVPHGVSDDDRGSALRQRYQVIPVAPDEVIPCGQVVVSDLDACGRGQVPGEQPTLQCLRGAPFLSEQPGVVHADPGPGCQFAGGGHVIGVIYRPAGFAGDEQEPGYLATRCQRRGQKGGSGRGDGLLKEHRINVVETAGQRRSRGEDDHVPALGEVLMTESASVRQARDEAPHDHLVSGLGPTRHANREERLKHVDRGCVAKPGHCEVENLLRRFGEVKCCAKPYMRAGRFR